MFSRDNAHLSQVTRCMAELFAEQSRDCWSAGSGRLAKADAGGNGQTMRVQEEDVADETVQRGAGGGCGGWSRDGGGWRWRWMARKTKTKRPSFGAVGMKWARNGWCVRRRSLCLSPSCNTTCAHEYTYMPWIVDTHSPDGCTCIFVSLLALCPPPPRRRLFAPLPLALAATADAVAGLLHAASKQTSTIHLHLPTFPSISSSQAIFSRRFCSIGQP